jgi:hypothetical protein
MYNLDVHIEYKIAQGLSTRVLIRAHVFHANFHLFPLGDQARVVAQAPPTTKVNGGEMMHKGAHICVEVRHRFWPGEVSPYSLRAELAKLGLVYRRRFPPAPHRDHGFAARAASLGQ